MGFRLKDLAAAMLVSAQGAFLVSALIASFAVADWGSRRRRRRPRVVKLALPPRVARLPSA